MRIDQTITAKDLSAKVTQVLSLGARKARELARVWDSSRGTPVFTVQGQYTTRGWTEWTKGFAYGLAILAFDGTDEIDLLEIGRRNTVDKMAPHVTHVGVHDHGFNNLSTYGNLRRLMREGRIEANEWERVFYELALKASGAVQAARWAGVPVVSPTPISANTPGLGYIYSFNGPHSLFIDTMRSCRSLGVAWQLGQKLMHENDRAADLLKRSILHGLCTNQYLIFHGDSGQVYDVRGRSSHEGIFNRGDGSFRTRSTQQGYSPFSTWTRGLAWAILGYAEELEFIATIDPGTFKTSTGLEKTDVIAVYELAGIETADHYTNDCSAADGIVYWDDGAPGLAKLGDWQSRAAEPFNDHEPVDSSAAAIASQGLIRLGRYLGAARGKKYEQAGYAIAGVLMSEPYLSTGADHQGLLLHSVYHRPNNWDHVPPGRKIPCGESGLWGDYHLMELAVLLQRLAESKPYLTFFDVRT